MRGTLHLSPSSFSLPIPLPLLHPLLLFSSSSSTPLPSTPSPPSASSLPAPTPHFLPQTLITKLEWIDMYDIWSCIFIFMFVGLKTQVIIGVFKLINTQKQLKLFTYFRKQWKIYNWFFGILYKDLKNKIKKMQAFGLHSCHIFLKN